MRQRVERQDKENGNGGRVLGAGDNGEGHGNQSFAQRL